MITDIAECVNPESVKTIVELGSRDGLDAITLWGTFPNSRVYAFECNPSAIEKVRKNTEGIPSITLISKAVSAVDGPVRFHPIDPEKTVTPHEDGNIGASSMLMANPEYPHEHYVQNEIEVESTTLATWAQEAGVRGDRHSLDGYSGGGIDGPDGHGRPSQEDQGDLP